jgi:alpha-glucosidase
MTSCPHLWWQTGVIYQIYPLSFKDTTGNGVGDLRGVIERLGYLSGTLGIDAIWLSPFYRSPMADFGYDVADHTDVDPLFGSLETFDELVRQAHIQGVRVIVDLVPNHTSDRHPWFIESRSTLDNPKRDWYVWADPDPDGSPPNNWLSVFGGSAWEWDEVTEQYYLHSFLKEQPDLNWRNPEVKEAMFDVVRFWLERDVDGFRVDVAQLIVKDPYLRDNPIDPERTPSTHRSMGEYDSQFHVYDSAHPDVHGVYREFRGVLDAYSDHRPRVSIGEVHIFDWDEWASYYGEKLDELHMPFNFSLLNVAWDAQAVRHVVDSLEAALPERAWPNYVLGNHDEPRLASRYDQDKARVAAMLLLTLRGTPTLYYGDEIGMTNVPIPPHRQQDPWVLETAEMGRDPSRTPMQWSAGPNAGFAPPHVEELWLPLSEKYETVNVEAQLAKPQSILNLYRGLLAYRREKLALRAGEYQPLDDGVPEACYAFLRGGSVLVGLNFSDQDQVLCLPALEEGATVISTRLDRGGVTDLSRLHLRPNEGVVVELQN